MNGEQRDKKVARWKIIFAILVSLLLFYFLTPTLALKIRAQDTDAIIFCAPLAAGDEILYRSLNSIYNAPVTERWRIRPDGAIQVVEVVSSAAVMEYYHLDNFIRAGDEMYRAEPHELVYSKVKIKVDARGQEKLVVRGNEIALSALVPEANVVKILVTRAPLIWVCH